MVQAFVSDQLGTQGDTLYVSLNQQRVVTSTSWEHTEGILSQPCSWSLSLGWGGVAKDLLAKYPKGTPFQLYVGSVLQANGKIDAVGASQPVGGATTVTIRGRDALAKLHDTYVRAAIPVNVVTYAELVWYALQQCGLAPGKQPASTGAGGTGKAGGHRTVNEILASGSNTPSPGGSSGQPVPLGTIDPKILSTDNAANRAIKAGVPIRAILPHRTVQQILDDAGEVGPNTGACQTLPTAKLGETWHRFLRRYLDRAGLMLWAAANGSYILSAPNGDQDPTYVLARGTGDPKQGTNVVGYEYLDDATHRHTEYIIYGRGGGKALGRTKAKGGVLDQDLLSAGYVDQPIVFRDANVHSNAEAAFFARRKNAEERRNGFRLEYTIAGLTLPYIGRGTAARAVVTPDTVVAVDDQELGITDNFYIESVTRRRSPQTTTSIRLMRVDDLVFGDPDAG